jgi:hypothetical protein
MGDTQLPGGGQGLRGDLAGAVAARFQLRDAPGVDVEADHGAVLTEFDRERQADVAQADDGERGVGGSEVSEDFGHDGSWTDARRRRGKVQNSNRKRIKNPTQQ